MATIIDKGYKKFTGNVPQEEQIKYTFNPMPYTNNEFLAIKRLLSVQYFDSNRPGLLFINYDSRPHSVKILITKCQDEWFVLQNNAGVWLCDQFEGLINCIKDECM